MKPNEILAPVIKLSALSTDLMFWLSDKKESRFEKIETELYNENSSHLQAQIPDSVNALSAIELTDLSYQIKNDLEYLTLMLNNLDLKRSTYVVNSTEFKLSPEFHRNVYLSTFNALNILRSFDRAIKGTFHPSGEKGLKPKETTESLIEKIYHGLKSKGLIHEGSLQDFKAIFTDNHLPGTWNKIIFHFDPKDKSGIKTFAFELVEEITGLKVHPNCINKYFGFSDGSKTKTNNIKTAHRSKIYDTIFIKKRQGSHIEKI